MPETFITKTQLHTILNEFTRALNVRFSSIIKHNNQRILDYCEQCLESMKILSFSEETMLETLDQSIQCLHIDLLKDLEYVMEQQLSSCSNVIEIASIKKTQGR